MSRDSHLERFKAGLIGGIGWSLGVTIGFALISLFLVGFLNLFGGLPVIGNLIASLVEATNHALLLRNP